MKLTASQNGGIRADGNVQKHQGERELTNGFNLIFLGDGFTSDDLIAETGVFDLAVEEACEALFAVEPYKTYKEYFNVWSVAFRKSAGPELPSQEIQHYSVTLTKITASSEIIQRLSVMQAKYWE